MESCVFCALVQGAIPSRRVYEDADHVAFLPLKHIGPGHTLLIPRLHAPYVFEMPERDYDALWRTARRLAPAVRAVSGAARVGVLVEGFSVPHVHVHLVPVNALNDINPDREKALDAASADRLADTLRSAMSTGTMP